MGETDEIMRCPLFAIQAVQFHKEIDHFTFDGFESRLGRKSWVKTARVLALKHYLDSIFYASKIYQRKANFRI